MKFTDIFIKRPVLAIVVSLVILILGVQSYRALSVRQFPRSDVSVVTVRTIYVGASADLVNGFITTPLERAIASADGIDYLESSSSAGSSTITVRLKLNYDPTAALAQITSKVNQVKSDLPPGSEEPLIDIAPADSQMADMYVNFTSEDLEPNQVTDYLTRVVQPRLAAVQGIQKAEVAGGRTFAMRVWLKPEKLAALNISATQVRQALASNNFLSALGSTKGEMVSVSLTANTDLRTVEEFQQLVLREEGGVVVRLGDVADVELGAESYDSEARTDGLPATFIEVAVLPTANTLTVLREVNHVLETEIFPALPPGVHGHVAHDSSLYIQDAITEIISTLGETMLIVIIVLYLFLGSFRAVLIPVVAMPLSLVGAVFLMLLLGFTVNLLTLLAIVLAVGIVVDDAIVVVENIERHVREGQTPFEAAIKGARELVSPVIAMTITLVTVYAPIGFQGGLTGALFREFAFTLAGAVLISGVVALTLSPMMASRIIPAGHHTSGFSAWLDKRFGGLRRRYARVLRAWLAVPRFNWVVTLFIIIVVPLLLGPMFMFSQSELAPEEDQSFLFGILQPPPNATVEQVMLYANDIERQFQQVPEKSETFMVVGPGFGFAGLVLKPWGQRTRTTKEVFQENSAKLSAVGGMEVFSAVPPGLPGGSSFPVSFVVASTAAPEQVNEVAQAVLQRALQSGKLMFAFTGLRFDRPEAQLIIDRDKAAALGLDMQQIGADLGSLLGGGYVNRFSIQGRSYKVIPQIKRSERLNVEQLGDIHVSGPDGRLIPLSTFATFETSAQPRQVERFQQLNAAIISGQPLPGVTLDQALKVFEDAMREVAPSDYFMDYGGESRQLRQEGEALTTTLILALILIYLVLAAKFESFRDPFIVLLGSVPLAMFGALSFTFLGATSLNIYSQVGLVTLIGLIAKNGILIVEFANTLQIEGKEKFEALIEAASLRLRPILMTTAATVFGHMPLVFVTGAGAAARNSIGLVLVAGMAIGTVFTLFIVPSVYMAIARDHKRATELEHAREVQAGISDNAPAI
ncbi:acriflavine resistance protein B [Cephaloticoccus primus]|uniref:Acriflavine resistance protein B n=1 Tax=Cephaloticoccus primus TaxID=1548207 RepID=A0A139SLR0_9BACT|nr:efflux RND transporter permease subunit [Cephaloticoccus primus]KXU35486.1 acriflavine resistance protein B [Cephaloticoccus primus]